MKNIHHNYWTGEYEEKDADLCNPDLVLAMQELYGRKGFDFGKGNDRFNDKNKKNHYRPDGYSVYTPLNGNYSSKMPFRRKTVENNKELADKCFFLAGTIAGEIFFPCRRLDGMNTMNQSRGELHGDVKDMMYITLDSIKKYYAKEDDNYPLKETIETYGYFFDCFDSFDEYIEYNLLQDYELLPKKFPTAENELVEFWEKSVEFLEARLQRIEEYAKQNGLLEE
ncbi:hypothetical protein MmiAt1_08410 [Methanimicrococcus sp. At1]|uniref:Uncharacterized protein n=1 Tax=Methanimicrococcus hacksteinii TaxID=3028293 RepID=A0ABU3VPE1_9EURY|nr:hypothetical protein [Methanimicrococcus sp. At1]MDV0445273.1 hypothetical protein [Methanimicrococcus sp. At1]